MKFIEPHIHMVSRTTDDYLFMARAGVVGVSEPAFWAGFDRSGSESFYDYFRHLTDFEPKRTARYGIDHYSWLCINAKEADNLQLSREVIQLIPKFLDSPHVLGIGEIGLNKNTRNEIITFEEQVDLAARHNQLILVHTPHLEDKFKGTSIIIDILKNDRRINPERVMIDHCEEHTIRMARNAGFWAGLTVYSWSKCTPQRRRHPRNLRPGKNLGGQRRRLGRKHPQQSHRHLPRIPQTWPQRARSPGNLLQQPLPLLRPKPQVETPTG